MNVNLEEEIFNLKKSYLRFKKVSFGILLFTSIGLISLSFAEIKRFDVIRVKGIVIEDHQGRDRILLGAPIPYSKDRVRTDTVKVRKYWASQFDNPDQYMDWYKKYKNSSNGIVFMNEEGFDEVLVGEKLADANVGVRMFEMSGILFNNKKGWERAGAVVNTLDNGKTRQGFGVDDDSGEAMHMMTLEDGSKALILSDENGSIRIGMSKKPGELFQNKESFTGIKYFNTKGKLVWEQKM
ncbi:MAG: hypothetical protein IPJ13_21060 [Saprospiraceae bacterium]|nr:hypothetical protein [Saprospiraceae bacterium]MBP6445903.1 hypothetical protein [Saprospiraceae bacterium]